MFVPSSLSNAVFVLFVLLGCSSTFLQGCSSGGVASSTSITVSISPLSASVQAGKSQQFAAVVSNTTNTAVTWAVNGTSGGNITNGTISSTGMYTAPATIPSPATVTVSVVSEADSSRMASAQVTITAATPSLVITTNALPNGQVGVGYNATLEAAGGTKPYLWTIASGTLPAGLSLNASTGAVTGKPAAAISAPLAFQVEDSSSPAQTKSVTLVLTVTPAVTSLVLNPASVVGGGSSQGTVTLSGPALSGGATVTLTSANVAAAQVPASVVVPAAATQAAFTITTSEVSSSTSSVISASYNGSTGTATLTVTRVPASTAVLTYHNNNLRTGQNVSETMLTTANVNTTTFGKLFTLAVDGQLFAQPLYVPGVMVGTQVHNLLFVATEHDSVYAWDADTASTTPVWRTSFINPASGVTTIPCGEAASGDCATINPEFGITSTPVIDASTETLYVVAATKEVSGSTTNYVYRLHALSITTGTEKFSGPVEIQATSGLVTFNPKQHLQRPGLLLVNGVVYIGFGSHGDMAPWYGWLLGYNASTLQRVMVFNTAPRAGGASIWQSGGGPAADANGNIYFNTGNGGFDANSGGGDYGDSVVKLSSTGTVLDYFTPYNQASLDAVDNDLGSSGLVLLPDQSGTYAHVLIGAGKQGVIYTVNRDNMGKYNAGGNQNIQSLAVLTSGPGSGGLFGSPAYWNGNVYFSAWNDYVRAFQVTNGLLAQTSHSAITLAYPGSTPSVSSNGSSNGIVWIIQGNIPNDTVITNPPTAVLRAYDATNLADELYDSTQAAGNRDATGGAVKFAVPTIANGKVYVGNSNQVTVYGLLP